MKKYLLIPLLLLSSLYAYPRCAPELKSALDTIYHFPEGKKLISDVEAEGPISIHWARFHSKSPAMWVGDDRAIVINANVPRPHGEVIRSIFFELHNAIAEKRFERLDWLAENRQISKNDYVESVERIEHENACAVAALVEKAISQGYFPPNARWHIAHDFETHYMIQRENGHSGNIASLYDSLSRKYYGYGR